MRGREHVCELLVLATSVFYKPKIILKNAVETANSHLKRLLRGGDGHSPDSEVASWSGKRSELDTRSACLFKAHTLWDFFTYF